MADPIKLGGMTQMGCFPESPSPAALIAPTLLSFSCQLVVGLGSLSVFVHED